MKILRFVILLFTLSICTVSAESEKTLGDVSNVLELKKDKQTFMIEQTSSGILYSVKSQKGKWIAKDLNEGEIQKKHPQLFKKIQEALAEKLAKEIDPKKFEEKSSETLESEQTK
jgi:hypothetical protein